MFQDQEDPFFFYFINKKIIINMYIFGFNNSLKNLRKLMLGKLLFTLLRRFNKNGNGKTRYVLA